MPGYRVKDGSGETCIPFSYRTRFPPPGYVGDYYAVEFTDEKIKAAYLACRSTPPCAERLKKAPQLAPAGHQYRATGSGDAAAGFDPNDEVDLKRVRRPAFFGRAPYHEPIAAADDRTYTVEFTVPAEAYERLHLGQNGPDKLRGWYLQGHGIEDAAGHMVRALIVLEAGRSVETTATDFSDAPGASQTASGGRVAEDPGVSAWRQYIFRFNEAGFDVLTFDKRGHGISGGHNDTNTLEQGRDMLRALDALASGEGLRLIGPSGQQLEGRDAGRRLLGGTPAKEMPVILGGSSQGSMATAWAMQANFVHDCSYDLPVVTCAPPLDYNVKGALLLATFEGGIGNRAAPADVELSMLQEGRSRVEDNIVTLPSSEILAGIDRWPAVFFGKGLWDFAEALEATYDSYRRVRGLKEIAVVRGPHSEISWGSENMAHMADRMIAFSKAAVLGRTQDVGAAKFYNLKQLVASSPPFLTPAPPSPR